MSVQAVQTTDSDPGATEPRTFISYRRSDSPSAARDLARAFKSRFGAERVFFDVDDLEVASCWPAELKERVASARVVIAVIGPRWVGLADDRGRRAVVDPEEEDVLRREIETALRSRALLVPVLVEGAQMPERERLPRAFRPLAALQAVSVRHASWERDVEALIDAVDRRLAERRDAAAAAAAAAEAPERRMSPAGEPVEEGMPGDDHFTEVVEYIEDDRLLPVLGSSPYDDEPPWTPGCRRVPDRAELASALAAKFALPGEPADLARVAQHVASTRGAVDLHIELAKLLAGDEAAPAPVHRFLARIPALLRERGSERYQVILTTNYDSSLERAFDEAGEPFDVAVFMAGGKLSGKFVHIPWWDEEGRGAVPIEIPNEYGGFPINEYGEIDRTVIVKIHGGVLYDAPRELRRQYKHNFVITEDDYISYLSREPVENLIPTQLLDKLRDSHFLFLGYGVRDWSLRVFLRRVWDEQPHGWAVQRHLDRLDNGFWKKLDVERVAVPLSAYWRELERHLAQ